MVNKSIVALLVTRGMSDFLLNALTGLTRVGVNPRHIHVARPDSAADEVDPILREAGVEAHSFSKFSRSSIDADKGDYASFGSQEFIEINWIKVYFLIWLLDRHDHVIYADVDVGWISNPLGYLRDVSEHFPLAFQTEAVPRYPPALCWGFLAARRTFATRRFFRRLQEIHRKQPPHQAVNEQVSSDEWITAHPRFLRKIYLLPENLFINGLGYRSLTAGAAPIAPMEGALRPFIFHANWTVGLKNKRALMRQTGTWLLD